MMLKTHSCGTLTKADVGQIVTLNGWVQRRRDLGGVLFIDLRDRTGLVQTVFNPDFSGEALEIADKARNEYVLAVRGKVVERDAETFNANIATGEIEIRVTEIEILNAAKTPPFPIEDGVEVDEPIRLKHRYLDLRRPEMQRTMLLRSKTTKVFRDFLDGEGFLDVETPILTKSTPEAHAITSYRAACIRKSSMRCRNRRKFLNNCLWSAVWSAIIKWPAASATRTFVRIVSRSSRRWTSRRRSCRRINCSA